MLSEDLRSRREIAIKRCKDSIAWYEKHKRRSRITYQVLQSVAVIFGALTPLLLLSTDLPKPVQALPAVLASIAIGLIGAFHFQENWTRFASTLEQLKSELVKFETRTTDDYLAKLDESEALENFVTRMESLKMREVNGWRVQILEGKTKRTNRP